MLARADVPGAIATGATKYVRTDSNNIQKNTFSTRHDHNFTANTRLLARYSYDDTPWIRTFPYGPANLGSPAFGPQDFTRYNSVLELNQVFSLTLVAVVRGSYSRLANQLTPLSNGFDITQLGFPATLSSQVGAPAAFPAIDITGYSVSSSISNNSRTGTHGETGLINFGMNNCTLQRSCGLSPRIFRMAPSHLRLPWRYRRVIMPLSYKTIGRSRHRSC